MYRVSLDAMGGDNAPLSNVEGAILAVNKNKDVRVILVGREEEINSILSGKDYDKDRISVVNATEVIETGDHPVDAIRSKKDASLAVGMKLVKNGDADAFVSAGNSGALMVGGQVYIGREKGVDRGAFAQIIPTSKGPALLLDCGANVDVRPEHLLQFAVMGSNYMRNTLSMESPRVALLNIGAEETKGNELVKNTYPLMKELDGINFTGFVEPNHVTDGDADVIVCDGFAGNCIIKFYEGVGKLMMRTVKNTLMSSLKTKIGALLIKDELKASFKQFDAKQYGGAPILGLKALVIKPHGNADAGVICNAVLQCRPR